jgi:hypothetical protein
VRVVGTTRSFDVANGVLLLTVRKRPAPQGKEETRAYRASLEAAGKDPVNDHSNEQLWKMASEEDMVVVEVVLQPWSDRKTGRFVQRDPAAGNMQTHVVPVHLIRSAVSMATSRESTKVTHKVW